MTHHLKSLTSGGLPGASHHASPPDGGVLRGHESYSKQIEMMKLQQKFNQEPWWEKVTDKLKEMGPGGGVGLGCGMGLGMGLVGTVGAGAQMGLRFAFGVGAGCGVGVGYGYGAGMGKRWDKTYVPPSKQLKAACKNLKAPVRATRS